MICNQLYQRTYSTYLSLENTDNNVRIVHGALERDTVYPVKNFGIVFGENMLVDVWPNMFITCCIHYY